MKNCSVERESDREVIGGGKWRGEVENEKQKGNLPCADALILCFQTSFFYFIEVFFPLALGKVSVGCLREKD